MFERLSERGRALAERASARTRARLATEIAASAPRGVAVTIEGEAVVLSGRRLRRRWAGDGALRRWAELRR